MPNGSLVTPLGYVDESLVAGHRGSLSAVGGAELGQDVGDVDADSLGGDEQQRSHFAIRAPQRDVPENFGLSWRQTGGRG